MKSYSKKKLIKEFKIINNNPYLITILINILHHTNELYCLSSSSNNWKNYYKLLRLIKTSSINDIPYLLNHLKKYCTKIYDMFEKDGEGGFFLRGKEDENLLKFAFRLDQNIKVLERKIKKINKYVTWKDVENCIEKFQLKSLPQKKSFNNKEIKKLCKKYHFKHIKVDILFNSYNIHSIKKNFSNFCEKLNISSNLGDECLSLYIKLNYYTKRKEKINSHYISYEKSIFLNDWYAFIHEWGHYLDSKAYENEFNYLIKNKKFETVISECNNLDIFYHSDFIQYRKNIINSNIFKYESLYKIMENLLYEKNKKKESRFYQICQEYEYPLLVEKGYDANYFHKKCEIFARVFEVYAKNILKEHEFVKSDKYYDWKIYPSQKEISPIVQDLKKFIQQITSDL